MRKFVTTILWRILACLALCLGIIGIIIPGLPTVPFILVAAWSGSKGWPALEYWLLNHQTFGPHIINWRKNRIVPVKAKWASTIFMSASCVMIWYTQSNIWVSLCISLILIAVACWIWTRNSE
ncbi:YbaN family protein [Agaribacter marinus]|uniref:YbaN family protein n=1 Tax=Agaribacter marinus TaxID=1431249 RepID=UPI003D679515